MDWVDLPKQRDSTGEDLDGVGKYLVVDPSKLYRGKSYSDWTCDWVNWFLSSDADRRNSGPVVFVRSKGLPNKMTGANISDVPGVSSEDIGSETFANTAGDDTTPYSLHAYVNDPNVKIGGDKLNIFDDQAVFVPIIVTWRFKLDPQTDWGRMQDLTGLTIDYGDNPPDISQLTINGRDIDLTTPDDVTQPQRKKMEDLVKKESGAQSEIWDKGNNLNKLHDTRSKMQAALKEQQNDPDQKNKISDPRTEMKDLDVKKQELVDYIDELERDLDDTKKKKFALSKELNLMERFRIATPIFNTVIPEAQFGRSAKDFIEEAPISPGSYLAMADGYFVMLKFEPGTYWIHSWASAPREGHGPYFSELLYQIEVHKRTGPRGKVTRWRPSRNERLLRQILTQKENNRELTRAQKYRLIWYLQSDSMSKT